MEAALVIGAPGNAKWKLFRQVRIYELKGGV
jgi:hypothetical protein